MKRVWGTIAMAILWLAGGLGGGMAQGQGLVINEFMAVNDTGITNRYGERADWIELFNAGGSPVNLAGWHLTDSSNNLVQWTFPATNLAAGTYLIVFASGRGDAVAGQELHTSFKLGSAGEYLALVQSDGVTIEHPYEPAYPPQEPDVSFGIATNVVGGVGYFTRSSPGAANSNGLVAVVADTKFSVDRGLFLTNFTVAVTSATAGVAIRYTTNAELPTVTGPLYAAPFNFTHTAVIRAAGFKSGWVPSGVDTHSYIVLDDVLRQSATPPAGYPGNWSHVAADYGMDQRIVSGAGAELTNALELLPTISIVTAKSNLFDVATGIYVNPGQTGDVWERAVSAEWITTNNTSKFQVDCGLQMQGNAFRTQWSWTKKKSFQFKFKAVYGEGRLKEDLFSGNGLSSFNDLVLRAGGNDAWNWYTDAYAPGRVLYFIDEFVRRSHLAMGGISPRGRFVHLYLNGLYWGLYNLTEHVSGDFAADYYGGLADSWVVLGNEGDDLTAWNNVLDLLNIDRGSNATYQRVQGKNEDGSRNPAYPVYLDVDNYIDYMIVQNLFKVGDWSTSNYRAFRDRNDWVSTGFKFAVWDAEGGLGLTPPGGAWKDGVAEAHARLVGNVEYKLRFADHVQKQLFNGGALTPASMIERYRAVAGEVDPALVAESARWGDQFDAAVRTVAEWRARTNEVLNTFLIPCHTNFLRELRELRLYPGIDAPVFNQQGGAFSNGFQLVMTATTVVYYTLDGTDPRVYGTGSATGTLYSGAVTLPYSVRVKARARSAGGEWSALNEACFVKQEESPLRITEVMYHPRSPVGTETNGGWSADDFQFVEVRNTGTQTVGLAGMRFTDGGSFDFNDGALTRLLAGETAVIVKNKIAFTNRYAALMPISIAGEFKKLHEFPQSSLSHDGETVTLKDGTNGVVAQFTYGDGRDWPLAADGAGHSLVSLSALMAVQTNGALDYGGNWRASTYRDGSPGRADPDPVTDVVINEVMAHTDFENSWDSNDWIEFYNTKTSAVAFATNWFLSDDPADLTKWMIPGTNSVAGTNWITFFEQTGFHFPTNLGFGLNKAGDALYLSYLAGSVTDRVVDCVQFKAQANFRTWGRFSDGALRWCTTLPTTNRANALVTNTVVINEILYHPATNANYPVDNGDVEYVELYNAGAGAVILTNEGGACRLSGGVDYVFAPNTTLAAGAYLVLVPFDPATNPAARALFLAYYGLTNGQVSLMGPYSGRLSDGGDRVALEFPLLPDLVGGGVSWGIMDEVYYSDRMPWPENTDGVGGSLSRLQSLGSGNEPANWLGGAPTPGGMNVGTDAPPTIVAQPASVTVTEGVRVTFSVTALGSVSMGYQWYSDNVALGGATGPSYTTPATILSDSGKVYKVTVTNVYGAVISSNATLRVTLIPTYRIDYEHNGATSGATPSSQIKTQDVAVVVAGNSGNLARPGYLFVGWNTASNGLGTNYAVGTSYTANAAVTLYAKWAVATPPTITVQPASRKVVAGQAATFSVTATGSPTLVYQWYRDNVVIGGATAVNYTTPATIVSDSGAVFQVTVTNAYGAATSDVAMLTVTTGATITNYADVGGTNWTAHIFTNNGVLLVGSACDVQYLVVAGGGGGGGGYQGGGGGAGGVRFGTTNLSAGVLYTITVGAGGKGCRNGDGTAASNGASSSISNGAVAVVTAMGGGRGSSENPTAAPGVGGSGGGGGHAGGLTGANGTSGEGNRGGDGVSPDSSPWRCGGGGGAATAGGNGSGSAPGAGGLGTNHSICGSPATYGSGGKGGWRTTTYAGSNGVANSGNGGEGGGSSSGTGVGGNGGSGIVIVRYVTGADVDPFEAWRQIYFTAAQLTNMAVSGATGDPDSDGLSNEREYGAGTNPTNALSCLILYAPTNNIFAERRYVLRWQSVSNRSYAVQAATGVLAGFTNLMTNIPATPTVNVYTDNVQDVPHRFYRVRLE